MFTEPPIKSAVHLFQGRTAGRLIETYEKAGHSESQGTEALYNTNTNTSAPQIQWE